MDYKQFNQLNLGTMPTDELFNLYKQARTSSYKQPKLPMWDDPLIPAPQQETRYAPVEYTPEQAVSRANQQYTNDRHGIQQLGKIGAETASMLPTAVAGGLAGGSAMVGAKAGGATWDEALGSYNEASDAAKQVVHNVLGNPSELMEAFDTYGFAPVNEYITKQSGDPRLGERLMDLLVMRGGLHGKQGKVAEFGQKAADAGLVTGAAAISPQLQDMSTDELNKLALGIGAMVVAPKSIKEQIFNLQKSIRETPDPVQKAELGRQIKELQQSKPVQPQVPKELPYNPVNPEGGTFQSALLNAFEDTKFPQGKLNGPQLYKELKKRQVTNDEIQATYGDLQSLGIRDVSSWKNVDNAVSLGEDVYGTKQLEKGKIAQTADGEGVVIYNDGDIATIQLADGSIRYLNSEDSSAKQPQFSSYQAIKSQEGVVPGSYAEEFVTLENKDLMTPQEKTRLTELENKSWKDKTPEEKEEYDALFKKFFNSDKESPTWQDEHSQYKDTKNPMVRIRYDVKELPDGRKVMRLQELQDPKEVRKGRAGEGPVPQALATRAMDMGIKKAIARAKELGLDGIEWSTGEQQKDLYNSALRNVADEARWNPETQTLTTYKNGSLTHTQENVPREKIEDYIGKSGAERLLASEPLSKRKEIPVEFNEVSYNELGLDSKLASSYKFWKPKHPKIAKLEANGESPGYIMKTSDNVFEVYDNTWNSLIGRFDSLEKAQEAYLKDSGLKPKRINKDIYTATDLTIDAKWPTKLYGDFKTIGKSNKPLDIDQMYDKVVDNNVDIGLAFKPEFSKLFKDNRNYEAAKKYRLEDDYDIFEEAQEFQADLIQYIVENPNSDFAKRAMGENWQFDNLSVGSGDFDYSAQVPGLLKKYGKVEFGVSGGKIQTDFVLDKTNEGYFVQDNNTGEYIEGPFEFREQAQARRDSMNLDDPKYTTEQQPVMWFTDKTPSKFNIYEWAAITGLSVKMIEEYLNADDNKKQRMIKVIPVLGSIMTQRGNMRNTVGKTPSFIGREIAQPKALPSDAAVRAQEGIKNQILNSKLVPPGFPVRMTNVGELLDIANKSSLREGRAFEGNAGISAQVIPQGVKNPPIQSYGGNNLRSVAVIFPKDAVVNKGVNPNEVKINPSFDPNKARYLVSGYKRALTLTEVKSLIKKGLLTE